MAPVINNLFMVLRQKLINEQQSFFEEKVAIKWACSDGWFFV
jgi:hypothetical protein